MQGVEFTVAKPHPFEHMCIIRDAADAQNKCPNPMNTLQLVSEWPIHVS